MFNMLVEVDDMLYTSTEVSLKNENFHNIILKIFNDEEKITRNSKIIF